MWFFKRYNTKELITTTKSSSPSSLTPQRPALLILVISVVTAMNKLYHFTAVSWFIKFRFFIYHLPAVKFKGLPHSYLFPWPPAELMDILFFEFFCWSFLNLFRDFFWLHVCSYLSLRSMWSCGSMSFVCKVDCKRCRVVGLAWPGLCYNAFPVPGPLLTFHALPPPYGVLVRNTSHTKGPRTELGSELSRFWKSWHCSLLQ